MTDTRGTFRLHTVRQNVLNNEYVSLPSVWVKPDAADNAYIGGGTPADTRIDKITFATDGISNVSSANLNHGGGAEAGVFSSSSAGYFAAGSQGTPSSTSFDRRSYVRKLTYASETISNLSNPINHSPSGSGQGPRGGGGTMSATAGYVLGGQGTAGGNEQAWVSKLAFSSETWSAPPNLPSAVQYQGDALGNLDAGYLAGGSPGIRTMVQKITYADDTTSRAPSSDLPAPSRYCAAAGNATAGFIMCRQGDSPAHSSIFKFTYASGTASVLPSNFGIALRQTSGTGNSTKGYVGGGYQESGHDWSGVQKLTYETGTGSRNGSLTLGTARQVLAVSARDHGSTGEGSIERWFDSAGPSPNFGVFAGAGEAEDGSSLDKLDYSTETMSNAGSLSPGPKTEGVNRLLGGSSATNGYITTGQTNSYGNLSYVWKHTYSTATTAISPSNFTTSGQQGVGLDSSTATHGTNLYGATGNIRDVWKIVHADDSTSQVPALTRTWNTDEVYASMAVSNITDGTSYITAGGVGVPNWRSFTEKITFASSTRARIPAADYPTGVAFGGVSVGGPSAGYFGTGYSPAGYTSQLYKFTYAAETFSSVGNLTGNNPSGDQNEFKGSLGSELSGYIFAGAGPGPSRGSDVDKVAYSTDTMSNLPGIMHDPGQPAPNRYFRGIGCTGGVSVRQNNRPNIADVPTATPTASTFPSINPALNVNAVFAGGQGAGSSSTNARSKFTFSNETMASMPSFADSHNTYGGASSTTRGYLSGGFSNTSQGGTENKRWYNQYSNDTSGLLPSRTSQNAGGMYSMNDETKLYSGGGGWSGGQWNTAESMPFANETNTGEPGMTLTSPKKYASGIGNKTIGFVCGGNEGNNNRTTIDKVVYSTGTMSTSPSNLTLSGASPYHATMAVGNTTTGFIFQSSPTNKLVFATETVSSAPNNNTSTSWGNATSSATTGYCTNHPSGQYLIKYVFSTETTGTLPGMFSPNRGRAGAMSTAMFGGAYTSTPNLI
tara:strand:- start:565 stop:3570 length:3006 start_codon:yes stop_codon:yes gene_type:complete